MQMGHSAGYGSCLISSPCVVRRARSLPSFRPLVSAIALFLLGTPLSAYAAPAASADNHYGGPQAGRPKPRHHTLAAGAVVPAAQRACANRTPSGLGYTMLRPASGAKPAASDTVLINYIGYLAGTGAVFDQAMRSPLPVGDVIPASLKGCR